MQRNIFINSRSTEAVHFNSLNTCNDIYNNNKPTHAPRNTLSNYRTDESINIAEKYLYTEGLVIYTNHINKHPPIYQIILSWNKIFQLHFENPQQHKSYTHSTHHFYPHSNAEQKRKQTCCINMLYNTPISTIQSAKYAVKHIYLFVFFIF